MADLSDRMYFLVNALHSSVSMSLCLCRLYCGRRAVLESSGCVDGSHSCIWVLSQWYVCGKS